MVKIFFDAGGLIVQYRDKISPPSTVYKNFQRIRDIAKPYQGLCILNDFYEYALSNNMPFHIGQEDRIRLSQNRHIWPPCLETTTIKKPMFWGLSTHSMNDIYSILKELYQPDYIGVGSIFTSTTKQNVQRFNAPLEEVCDLWSKPIIFIGGITLKNIKKLPTGKNIYYALINDVFFYGTSNHHIQQYFNQLIKQIK